MERVLATYRLQLHPRFTLADARRRLGYLNRLGVSHLYLSPVFRARSGSTHGYDIVDPTNVNPELGGESELDALVDAARRHAMGLILDIVPNHMATGPENPFWEDVLRFGRDSPFAPWFDIHWGVPEHGPSDRVVVPVLGDRISRVIARGEIELALDDGELRFRYFDQSFPLDPTTVPAVAAAAGTEAATAPGTESELSGILSRLGDLAAGRRRSSPGSEWSAEARRAAEGLAELCRRVPAVHATLDAARHAFDSRAGEPARRRLRRLLDAQRYRLVYWRRAEREINYRRFFTLAHLVALRQEDPAVFEATHALVLRLIEARKLDGVRIDHVDGLLDPTGYLNRLRAAIVERLPERQASDFPIYVEKILARGERLPGRWPVAGTTGYDFLNDIEDALIDPVGFGLLVERYVEFLGRDELDFSTVARNAKRGVLAGPLTPDVRRLARSLQELARRRAGTPPDLSKLVAAITETIVHLPVYRTYGAAGLPSPESGRAYLDAALERAHAGHRASDDAVRSLANELSAIDGATGATRTRFIGRFEQTCVPAAAKGIEDTAFYVFVPMVSRNEVGGEPDAELENAVDTLHEKNRARARDWPAAMLGLSTHDTKRSADVRARLDVLSEIPDSWRRRVRRWHRLNRGQRRRARGRLAPDRNMEYHFYQTLVGVWPLDPQGEDGATAVPGPGAIEALRERLDAYMQKAAREAKVRTSWTRPDPDYEAALSGFVRALLSHEHGSGFLGEVNRLASRIARPGLWNSLAGRLVQLTSPGVPDVYRGDEVWNFSLVDPDNRRPVDFDALGRLLSGLEGDRAAGPEAEADARALVSRPEDGRIKLHVAHRCLQLRRRDPDLFARGDYRSLRGRGNAAEHVLGFARTHQGRAAIVAVPRRPATLVSAASEPPIGAVWRGTWLGLGDDLAEHRRWTCVLTGRTASVEIGPADRRLLLEDVLAGFPVALLVSDGS